MTDNRTGQEQWVIMLDRLKHYAEQGLSARAISIRLSDEYGWTVTRAAVMGKLHREGLRTPEPHVPAIRVPYIRKHSPQPREISRPPPLSPGAPVHILDLQWHHCRWIEGPASSLLYCGQPTESGVSWCPQHRRIVYGTSRVRGEC